MGVYVLLLLVFLSGGTILTKSITAPSKADCEAAITPIVLAYQDKRLSIGGAKENVLDVQGQCFGPFKEQTPV